MIQTIPHCYLKYDFTYEGQRHSGKIALCEGVANLEMMYFHHDLEIAWSKPIRHKGKRLVINIVVNDDANNPDKIGKVVASAWVCVYALKDKRHVYEEFEPENWLYIDEENPINNVSKVAFYGNPCVGIQERK